MTAQHRADSTLAAMHRVREVTSSRERHAERAWMDHILESSQAPRIAPKPVPESRSQKMAGVILAVIIGALLAAWLAHWWAT